MESCQHFTNEYKHTSYYDDKSINTNQPYITNVVTHTKKHKKNLAY